MSELIHLDHRSLMQFSFLMMASVSIILSGYILTGNRTRNIIFLNLGNLVYTLFFFSVSVDIAMPLRRIPEVVAFLDLTAVILWVVSLCQTIDQKSPARFYLILSILHLISINIISSITGTVSLLRMTTSLIIVLVLAINSYKIIRNADFKKLESHRFTSFTLFLFMVFKFIMGVYRVITHNFETGIFSIETSINVFTFLSMIFALWLNFAIMFLNYDVKRNEVERLSMYDHLTKLPNRKLLVKTYEDSRDSAENHQQSFAIALLDIDDFKKINDVYGHNIGDEVLQDFAAKAFSVTRDSDFVSRYGGEEFLIILAAHSAEEMEKTIERILEEIRFTKFSSLGLKLTASVGAIFVDHQYADVEFNELAAIADKNLYDAKGAGKDQAVYCEFVKSVI